ARVKARVKQLQAERAREIRVDAQGAISQLVADVAYGNANARSAAFKLLGQRRAMLRERDPVAVEGVPCRSWLDRRRAQSLPLALAPGRSPGPAPPAPPPPPAPPAPSWPPHTFNPGRRKASHPRTRSICGRDGSARAPSPSTSRRRPGRRRAPRGSPLTAT